MTFTITTVGGVTTYVGTEEADSAVVVAGQTLVNATAFEGNDLLDFTAANQNGSTIAMGDGIDNVIAAASTFTNATVKLNAGQDNFNGTGAITNSIIKGGKKVDTISTGALATSSEIRGGKGSDVITVASMATSSSIGGGNGNDAITVTGGAASASQVFGGSGNDNITVGAGGDGTATVFGGDGTDTITVGNGGYIAYGEADDDTISAGTGADFLYGGEGDDSITGGAGIDFLSGGTGANTFIFAAGDSSAATPFDVISDWATGTGNTLDYGVAMVNVGTVAGSTNASGYITAAAAVSVATAATAAATAFAGGAGAGTAGQIALWNDGTTSYLFISDAANAVNDVIQLNALAATSFTLSAGNISSFA